MASGERDEGETRLEGEGLRRGAEERTKVKESHREEKEEPRIMPEET